MNLLKQIRPLRYSSSEEKLYCQRHIDQDAIDLIRDIWPLVIIYHLASMFFLPIMAHPALVPVYYLTHGISLVFVFVVSLDRFQKPKTMRLLYFALSLILVGGYLTALLVLYKTPDVETNYYNDLYAGLMAVTAITLFLLPNIGRLNLVVTGLIVLYAAFVGSVAPFHDNWILVFISTACFSVAYKSYLSRIQILGFKRQYELTKNFAPIQVMNGAVESTQSIANTFKNESKFCVCISSDWRGYQKLSSQINADALAKVLEDYYGVCIGLLNHHFPCGNYFADWIADELFVVIYPDESMSDTDLVNAALEYSLELLQEKIPFYKKYGLPEAIDIGISTGQASLGLMGPKNNRKLTALGEVPGRSRRIQGTGKLLRARLGEQDRVILGLESLMQISKAFPIKSYTVEGRRLRDLEDDKLFYIQLSASGKVEFEDEDGNDLLMKSI